MARIRSTHPGQWTAGDFLECSPLARLLALALRNHADDQGAFRWKPKSIKAECLPADNCDIDALLDELVAHNQVIRYEVEGKEYGLIRDFTQWQRPKKPKYVHPVPDEYRTSSEPVEDESGTSSEILPQRKEEGGRREKKEEGRASALLYAFEGKVVKLRKKNFDDWVKAFPRLDLLGELTARDAWLSSARATDADRANWFASTSQHLANRNMAAGAKVAALKPDGQPRRGIEGIV